MRLQDERRYAIHELWCMQT